MTHVPFVGREAEFGPVRACLADAGRGRGRILLVGGEPGSYAATSRRTGWYTVPSRQTA